VIHPPYTVRKNPRARRVTLKVTPEHGLVVVVPPRFDLTRVPAIVQANVAWIDRAAERVGQAHATPVGAPVVLPAHIVLPAVGEEWHVCYVVTDAAGVRITAGAGRLTLRGPVRDDAACRAALLRWLGRRAHEAFEPLVDEVARELGYSYSGLTVRNQRTRWGSYSRRGTISLNCQLLFLGREMVRYIVVHELCHTQHFDHSPRFWALVRRHEPACDRLRREVRLAKPSVPRWVVASPVGAVV
jgi:predicted metal-dependent hydrolase